MRRQIQQSLWRYADNMDYLATTECHEIVYRGEKQKSTSSDGCQKNCWLSISSPPLRVSFRVAVAFDCCLPIVIKCNPSDHLFIDSRLDNLLQMRKIGPQVIAVFLFARDVHDQWQQNTYNTYYIIGNLNGYHFIRTVKK